MNKKNRIIAILFAMLFILTIFVQGCTTESWSVSYTGDYCKDGLQDRDEEAVDCGGQYCDSCNADDESE